MQWDLSIFGQGLWKLSHGEAPDVTIRGLHLFGEHATYVHLLLAPLFRLWPDVGLLVVVQSLALAASAWLIFSLARERLERGALGLLVLGVYLLYPPLQHSWLEFYQPDALAIPFLILAWRSLERGQQRGTLLWAAAALVTKENVAATTFALGLYAMATGRRRIGIGLTLQAVLYLVLVMAVLFPLFNPGQGYVYAGRLYSDFASSLLGAISYLADPRHLWQRLATAENARYLAELLVPLAGLPLLAPLHLLPAAQLPLNLVSSWPYAHEVRYHYTLLIIPFLFLALVAALARLKGRPFRFGFVCGFLAAATCASQYSLSPMAQAVKAELSRKVPEAQAELQQIHALLQAIPAGASVSADYRFLPQLCLRERVYLFPDLGPTGPPPRAVIVDLDRKPRSPREEAAVLWLLQSGLYDVSKAQSGHATLFLLKPSARSGGGP